MTAIRNDLNIPTGQRSDKAFATLAAQLALHGHGLARSDPSDGPVRYYATRWGMVHELPDLEAVESFAKQVMGGRA